MFTLSLSPSFFFSLYIYIFFSPSIFLPLPLSLFLFLSPFPFSLAPLYSCSFVCVCACVCVSDGPTISSLRVVRGDPMVQCSWVRDSLPVLFFLVSVMFFIPYERITCPGWGRGFHSLCLVPFVFLRSSHLSSFLALLRADSAVAG